MKQSAGRALPVKEISTRLEGKIPQKTLTEALGWLTDPEAKADVDFPQSKWDSTVSCDRCTTASDLF